MTIKISYSQALDLAQMAVAEKGRDYRYIRPYIDDDHGMACAYYDAEGKPSCIVGHILFRMGLFTSMERIEGSLEPPNLMSVGGLWDSHIIACDWKTRMFLATLQEQQDGGEPWGDCLHHALDSVAGLSDHEEAREKING